MVDNMFAACEDTTGTACPTSPTSLRNSISAPSRFTYYIYLIYVKPPKLVMVFSGLITTSIKSDKKTK